MLTGLTIAHLGPFNLPILFDRGGAIERRVREIAAVQARRGARVIVYSADGRSGRAARDGFELRSLPYWSRQPFQAVECLLRARRDLGGEKMDILHFHSLPEGATLFRTVPGWKVLSYDNYFFRRGKNSPLYGWYRRALREFSCLLPVSEYCKDASLGYWDLGDRPSWVLYNGVNRDQFRPDDASGKVERERLGLEHEQIVLYVGRVCVQKGTDTLIDAYQILRRRFPAARLVVAGPAEQFGGARTNELVDSLRKVGGLYLGAVEERRLSGVYNMCDVFVMPTRTLEMFGMAAAEAQACGKPVVCSDHGGLREVVSQDSGIFFPCGDATALADSIGAVLGDESRRRVMGEAARRNTEHFAWGAIADEIFRAYQDSMAASVTRHGSRLLPAGAA